MNEGHSEDHPALPLADRCRVCGTALRGPGALLLRWAGVGRSPRNPNVCTRCNSHLEAGTIREVTVLFADLSGFTALTHELGPEAVHGIVDAFLTRATDAIVAADGYLDKCIGDAVMAVFNAPIPREDHAARAFRAAMAVQELMPGLSREFGRELRATAGIARGYARIGPVGPTGKGDSTLLGDVVNLAARLQSRAQPGDVVVCSQVWRDLQAQVPEVPEERLVLKGFPEPVACRRIGPGVRVQGPEPVPAGRSRSLGVGALLFAVLGAPCAGAAVLSPLALLLGLGSLAGAGGEAAVHGRDLPWIRLPLLGLAVLGSFANLLAVRRGMRLACERPGGKPLPAMASDLRRTRWAVTLALLTLAVVVGEALAHRAMHPGG
jgi:adenylate cyclase